jgi:hypothetical protein
LGGASDVITIIGKSPEQVLRILEHESAQDQALHLTLIILDTNAHLRAKTLASEALEGLVTMSTIRQFVLDRLYARRLPSCADTADALRRCIDVSCKITWGLVNELRTDQPTISAVRDRWDRLGNELFGGPEAKQLMERIAMEEGIFFALCKHPERITDDAIEQWVKNVRLKDVPAGAIMRIWVEPFRVVRKEVAAASQLDLFAQSSR